MSNTTSIKAALDRFGISQADLARCLGVDPSSISHRMRRGWPDWKVSEATSLLDLINREHDPEFTLEDLVGGVGEDPRPQDLPQTQPTAGLTPVIPKKVA